jgi:taurine dioxygenase
MDRNFDSLTPRIGTEIVGVDLATVTPGDMQSIRRLLQERLVLVFRDQRLSREQHKALGRCFGMGVLHRHAGGVRAGGDPEVLPVRTNGRPWYSTMSGWHSDQSSERNPIGTSLLYLLEPPAGGGGDTVFVNMYAAYEALSDPMKDLLGKLSAIHVGSGPWKDAFGGQNTAPTLRTAEHPVVVKHPETGRKLLWVNRGFTSRLLGVSVLEGRHLLEALFQHIESNPELQCRVRWRANTLVMWDNVAAQYHTCWDYHPSTSYGEWVSSVGYALEEAR